MERRRRARGHRGASIIELALIAPVMVLIVMGALDLSRAYRLQIRLENAAREGAGYAQITPNRVDCATGADIIERVAGEDADLPSHIGFQVDVLTEDINGDVVVPVTGCGGTAAGAGKRVRVDVGATFDVMVPMVERIVGGTIDLTGSAEIEVQG